ncbi:hypothetical protein HWV62_21472 [Athelia sp. TMB]|nr:hypothetical protein HWV62_21472 [Athelia sp. TMB]
MIQAGNASTITRLDPLELLRLANDISSDDFPALQSVAANALSILHFISKFKSNKKEWSDLGQIMQNCAIHVIMSLSESVQDASDTKDAVEAKMQVVIAALEGGKTQIVRLQSMSYIQRMRNFRKDPEIIAHLKKQIVSAVEPFQVMARNSLGRGDSRRIVARVIERYRSTRILEPPIATGSCIQTVKTIPADHKYIVDQAPIPAVTFTTCGTLGGHVINVAGDYVTHEVNDEHLVAKMKNISALDKLPYADGSSWNSKLACLSGTRITALSLIHAWARTLDQHKILCLKGVAGSGKTAIAHAVAQALDAEGLLTSCFFFERTIASRNTSQLLFTTIARDIASLYPAIAADICASLEKRPALASAELSRQFEAFIAGPLRRHSVDRQIIVVIDALDEAIHDDLDIDLLTILRDEFATLPPYFRVLITSRSTRIIEQYLSGKAHVSHYHIDIDSVENRQDIAAYIDAELRDGVLHSQMGTPWPDELLIQDLKTMAAGLFIWIATVFRYLRGAYNPKEKLRALLSKSSAQGRVLEPTRKIDALYSTILEASGDWGDKEFCDGYALFMGSIMAIKRPLSLAALRALHGGNRELSLDHLLQRFGSVLVGLHDENKLIHTLHLSFREFVTGRAAERAETRKFFLSEKEHSQMLSELCIQTMVHELTAAPIAGTGYLARDEDDGPGIPELSGISEQLLYGCEHWSNHICDVESPTIAVARLIREFLPYDNTTWIEIVTSTSTFVGSLAVWRWLNSHATELKRLYDDASQAQALSRLSFRLKYSGRLEEALTAIEDSVQLRREIAAQQPEIFNTELADSLHNFSNRLSDLGRREEALTAIQEAVEVYRPLAAERPAAFNADLADSVNNLSLRLSDLGRHDEALKTIQEAVGLYRSLATEQPAAFHADLAMSLTNLSSCLSHHGRHEEALAANQEAVSLRQTLAAEQPETFNAELAESLNNLSVRLSEHGRPEEALTAIQEAVVLRRSLVVERPAAFSADLASSLNNLSNCLSDLGRHEEALAAIQEAAGLHRTLAEERPAAFNAYLASSLKGLSVCLSKHDRHIEALAAIQEAAALYRTLAAERPAAFNAYLASSLNGLSVRLSEHRRHEEALAANQEAVRLRRTLAAERPGAFNADLASSLNNLSARLSDHDRHKEALAVLQEAVGLRRALAAERPAAFSADLAQSLYNLSIKFSRLGCHKEALEAIQESARMYRALAAERPEVFTSDLSDSLRMLSKRLLAKEAQSLLL